MAESMQVVTGVAWLSIYMEDEVTSGFLHDLKLQER